MSAESPRFAPWSAAVLFGAAAVLIGYSLPRGGTGETPAAQATSTAKDNGPASAAVQRNQPKNAQLGTKQGSKGSEASAAVFSPPSDGAIPDGAFGEVVRLGQAIFHDTQHNAKGFVGNDLQCSNCHLDKGRMANSAPLWAAYVSYPAYRSKNGHVNTFQERLQGCFRFSMNGKAPPLDGKVLVALESYAYFLAKGAPTGESEMAGRGYPKLKAPAGFDMENGKKVYAASCALCHGADGQGQKAADGTTVFPPLWGARSFNWGAGMGSISTAAAFIKANMPFSQGNTLSDKDAWDVAAYVDSHERPQDPRFTGNIAETRKKYHDSRMSLYGTTVGDVTLGADSPPSGLSQ